MPYARHTGMRAAEDARTLFVLLAARLVGDFLYSWGGESADEGGFDCSGYASECLMQVARSFPEVYSGGRTTAAGLASYFTFKRGLPCLNRVDDLRPGCLVFYRRHGGTVFHVAIHAVTVPETRLGGRPVAVGPVAFESGGAGSDATSPRQALVRSAGIRLSASDEHGAGVEWFAVDPFALLEAER